MNKTIQDIIDFLNKSDKNQAITTTAGGVLGNMIGGNYDSGVGNALSGLSTVAQAIPGPWGAIASTGLNVLGGVTNRLFGSSMNEQNIAKVENTINNLNSMQSDTNSYDTLADTWSNTAFGGNFSNKYIGKDGLFSNKAKNKARALRDQMNLANSFALNTLENNADNIAETTKNNLEATYAALGGPLKQIIKGWKENLSLFGSLPKELGEAAYNLVRHGDVNYPYKGHFGGGLFGSGGASGVIPEYDTEEPKNFNEAYDQAVNNNQEVFTFRGLLYNTDKEVNPIRELNNRYVGASRKDSSEPMKDYIHQAGPFKLGGLEDIPIVHALGGLLHQYGNGGSIHINPANKGKFNATKKRTGKTTEELTHSKNPLTRKRAIFAQNAAKWNHAFGGELNTQGGDFSTGLTFVNAGSSHEENPYGGIMMGIAPDGNPNLVEEGEAIYNNYVFSNRLKLPKEVLDKYKLKGEDITFADAVKQISKDSEERPNDPVSKATLDDIMSELAAVQEGLKEETQGHTYAPGGYLRYAPAIGLGIMSATDALGITNKPDYTEADALEDAAKKLSYNPVNWTPISNKLTYRPLDRNYYSNKLSAEAGATRRAIANQSGGNTSRTIAGLLAADYNAQNQLGELFRKSEEYNREQQQRVEDFNRSTNLSNAQGILQADSANQQAAMNIQNTYLNALSNVGNIRRQERQIIDAAKANNLSGLLDTLGDIGREETDIEVVKALNDAGVFRAHPELLAKFPHIGKLKLNI